MPVPTRPSCAHTNGFEIRLSDDRPGRRKAGAQPAMSSSSLQRDASKRNELERDAGSDRDDDAPRWSRDGVSK